MNNVKDWMRQKGFTADQQTHVEKQIKTIEDAQAKSLNHWQTLDNPFTSSYFGNPIADDWKLLSAYTNNDVVHACIDKNALAVCSADLSLLQPAPKGTVSQKVLKLDRRRRKQLRSHAKYGRIAKSADVDVIELTDHPVWNLLTNDEEDLDQSDMLRLTVIYLQAFGRAYWHLENRVGDVPGSIRVLKPYFMTPMRDVDGDVLFYLYTNDFGNGVREKVAIDKDDVIDFRWPSPSDPYAGGDSPLRAAYQQVALSSKWHEYQNYVLDNKTEPGGILIPMEDTSPEEAEVLEKKFQQKLKGAKAGRTVVLDRKAQYVKTTMTPTDLGPLAIQQELKKSVCNNFHIPLALMEDDPNRAGIEGSLEQWAREGVKPICCTLEGGLNQLVRLFGDDTPFFCFENVVPEDEAFELEEQKAEDARVEMLAKYGAIKVNELRQHAGLDDVEGGDVLVDPTTIGYTADPAEGDAAATAAPVPPVAPSQPQADQGKNYTFILSLNDQVASGKLDRATAINIAAKALELDDDEAKKLVGYVESKSCACAQKSKHPKGVAIPDGKALVPVIRKAFNVMRDHFLSQIDAHKSVGDRIAKMFDDDSGVKSADGLPDEFVPVEDWTDDIAHAVQPVVEIYAKKGAKQIEARVGASPDVFAVVPPKIEAAMAKSSLKLANSTIQTTTKQANDALDQLRKELTDGLFDGDTVRELRNRVKDVFESIDNDRAELIARSEASRAVHEGLRIAAKASGLISGFKFLASSESCDICSDLNGTEIGLNEQFADSDYDDSILPIHPNCRCTVTEILKTDDAEGGADEE